MCDNGFKCILRNACISSTGRPVNSKCDRSCKHHSCSMCVKSFKSECTYEKCGNT